MKISKCLLLFLFLFLPEGLFPAAEYYFHQQFNDMCMVAPMLNLKIVEQLEKNNYKLDSLPKHTRRDWFVLNNKFLRIWHTAFSKVNDYNAAEKYPALLKFMNNAVSNGPIMPNFYDKDGNFSFKGIEGAKEIALIPYIFMDFVDLGNKKILLWNVYTIYNLGAERPALGLKIPLVLDFDNEYRLYEANKNNTEIIKKDLGKDLPNLEDVFKKSTNYNDSDVYSYAQFVNYAQLGFKKIAISPLLGGGFQQGPKVFIPYIYGLYKLMLLRLGLNNQNNFNKNKLYEEIKELVSQKDNPWSDNYFKKEAFLQYHIAEVFKQNKELFCMAKHTVDFMLKPWTYYSNLKYKQKYYKKVGQGEDAKLIPYLQKDIEPFIPGDEQSVAMMVTQAIRYLWYGACSDGAKAFYKATGAPKIPMLWTFGKFKSGAEKVKTFECELGNAKNKISMSFLGMWDKLLEELKKYWKKKGITRKHWISFDAHGWVASFDPKLIEMQNNVVGVDKALLKQLKIAGIESWLGGELNTFYKVKPIVPKSRWEKVWNFLTYFTTSSKPKDKKIEIQKTKEIKEIVKKDIKGKKKIKEEEE